MRCYRRYVLMALAAVVLAGCTNQREPAHRSIGDIDVAVLQSAPAVMSAAQSLAGAAAAKKDELTKALDEKWSGLAAALPGYMTAIRARIDVLSKKSSRKLAAGIDLDAARGSLSDAASLWSKAQAAFATGNMDEAVTTANSLKTNLEGLGAYLSIPREPRWQGEGADARRAAPAVVGSTDKPCNAADAPLPANPSGVGRFSLIHRCRLLIGS